MSISKRKSSQNRLFLILTTVCAGLFIRCSENSPTAPDISVGSYTASSTMTTFYKTFGSAYTNEKGESVQQTRDGGYIITGCDERDVYLIKTDMLGVETWSKKIGGEHRDCGKFVQQTRDGGYIITGLMNQKTVNGYNYDLYLIKTNSSGNVTWTKTFGGDINDSGSSVQQTNDGGYIITGSTESFGAGGSDIYLIKTNALGKATWTKTFGGAGDDYGISVQQTSDGGYVVVGNSVNYSTNNSLLIIKTNAKGRMIWEKTFDNSYYKYDGSVQQTHDGGYIVSGGNKLIKLNASGVAIWERTLIGISESLQQTRDRGYIISGYVSSSFDPAYRDLYLTKTDASGLIIWTKKFCPAQNGHGRSVQQTNDGGYIVAGDAFTNGIASNIVLIKTDDLGNIN